MVAVCFEDIKTSISYPIEEIRMAVKENSMGECNKSKDFVPLGSTNTTIKRSTNNAYSRKATVIWLDVLPIDLKQKLKQGKNSQSIFKVQVLH